MSFEADVELGQQGPEVDQLLQTASELLQSARDVHRREVQALLGHMASLCGATPEPPERSSLAQEIKMLIKSEGKEEDSSSVGSVHELETLDKGTQCSWPPPEHDATAKGDGQLHGQLDGRPDGPRDSGPGGDGSAASDSSHPFGLDDGPSSRASSHEHAPERISNLQLWRRANSGNTEQSCVESFTNRATKDSDYWKGVGTGDLQLWDVWRMLRSDHPRKSNRVVGDLMHRRSENSGQTTGKIGRTPYLKGKTCFSRLIMVPGTQRQIVWDTLSMLLILLDMIWMPLMVFESKIKHIQHWGIKAMEGTTATFWTLDILRSFLLGFFCQNGMIDMRPREVAKRYIRSWFVLDVTLVSIDWTVFTVDSEMDGFGILRVLKTLRVGRSIRLIRMFTVLRTLRVSGVIQEIQQQISNVWLIAMSKIGLMMLAIFICNHWIACGWYGLVLLHSSDNSLWTDIFFLHQETVESLYTASLHWSLAQFMSTSIDIVPVNTHERTYNIFITLLAMILFTQLIGNIASTMTDLNMQDSENTKKQIELRRYLSTNDISTPLTARVWQCVREAEKDKEGRVVKCSQVELIRTLPKWVQADLRQEVYQPVFQCHPFFLQYQALNPTGARRLCDGVVDLRYLEAHEEVFVPAIDVCQGAVFLSSGSFRYVLSHDQYTNAVETDHEAVEVPKGGWACEVALWLQWRHRGTMTAESAADVYVIDAEGFRRAMGPYAPLHQEVLTRYAALYQWHAVRTPDEMDYWWHPQLLRNMAWAVFNDSEECNWEELLEDLDPASVVAWHTSVRKKRLPASKSSMLSVPALASLASSGL